MDNEAKVVETKNDFDSQADAFFASQEKGTPGDTSHAEETKGTEEADKTQGSGADQTKNATESEEAKSPVEEKLAKIAEILGNDTEAIEAYIKQKGYHKDPAWQKLLAKSKSAEQGKESVVDTELKQQIDRVNKITSSPSFIRWEMQQQGYKEEAINAKLKELGHEVETNQIDITDRLLKRYNIQPQNYATQQEYEQAKSLISDVATIARDIASEIIESKLGEKLQPLEKEVGTIQAKETAHSYAKQMRETVKNEGILDFEKEIEPELNKFLDEHTDATQEDVLDYFYDLNHKLALAKLTTKGKKDERDNKLENARSNKSGLNIPPGKIKRTGDFETDAEAWFAEHNIR